MRAETTAQMRLLDLQAMDDEIARLHRRRSALPTQERVADLERQMERTRRELLSATTQVEDLARDINRSEDELAKVRARAKRDESLAHSGVDARAQRELQHELASLARRLSDLEDAELELLERQDQFQTAANGLRATVDELAADLAAATTQRDGEQADVSSRLTGAAAERAELASGLPADLTARYERIRAGGGAGAARLLVNQCQGCRIELPQSEVARLRAAAPDEVEYCDECGAILVRTDPDDLSKAH